MTTKGSVVTTGIYGIRVIAKYYLAVVEYLGKNEWSEEFREFPIDPFGHVILVEEGFI